MIRIEDDILHLQRTGLLERLLHDRTTHRNIIWATDAHAGLGAAFERDKEIRAELITGDYSGVIRTRAAKEAGQQNDRTRQHGEVFTPLWVCRKMNDYADEMWFGRAKVFDRSDGLDEAVVFPEGKSWTDYVDSRRMEITCGEAPYLVSRYDVADGEGIPLKERTGILDRKLRIVNEHAKSEKDWVKWAFRAYEATYGYEFQGDNLLIARVNMIMTFEEYLSSRFGRMPTEEEYTRLVRVITWNIWQMDGLTGRIPYSRAAEEHHQMNLFEWLGIEDETPAADRQPDCMIYDWRSKRRVVYNSLKETNAV